MFKRIEERGQSDLAPSVKIYGEFHVCDVCGGEWDFGYTSSYSVGLLQKSGEHSEGARKALGKKDLCPRCRGWKVRPVQLVLF